MDTDVLGYRRPGPLTGLAGEHARLADDLPADPVGICATVAGLVVQPEDATAAGLPAARHPEWNIRPAHGLLDVLAALDPAPLHRARPSAHRVVGTCRHFALLAAAFLRLRGIPARVRCGFATYFVSGKYFDHWLTEYWLDAERRWVRVDREILGQAVVDRPEDLVPGQFLTCGQAWELFRTGSVDPGLFGVAATTHAWGVGEIRGNAIRDLAALHKVEMLPWDEWG